MAVPDPPLPLPCFRLMKGRWLGLGTPNLGAAWCRRPASSSALPRALQAIYMDLGKGRLLQQVWGWRLGVSPAGVLCM